MGPPTSYMTPKINLTPDEVDLLLGSVPETDANLDPFVLVAGGTIREANRDKHRFRTRAAALAALRGSIDAMFNRNVGREILAKAAAAQYGQLQAAAAVSNALVAAGHVKIMRLSEFQKGRP